MTYYDDAGVGAGASAGGVSSPHMLPGYNAKGATAGAGGGDGLQAGKGYHRVSGDGDGGVSRARSNSLAGAPTQSQAGKGVGGTRHLQVHIIKHVDWTQAAVGVAKVIGVACN